MTTLREKTRLSSCRGQSLIETALLVPLLLLLIFNVINFGFYFLVAIHLASAPREGVQYSVMGYATPGTLNLPQAGTATSSGSVAYLTYKDMSALVGTTAAEVRICTSSAGTTVDGSGHHIANCVTCNSSTSSCASGSGTFTSTPALDPESTAFVLHRVDVKYTVTPLINTAPFGLQIMPSYTFYRQVSMRAMN